MGTIIAIGGGEIGRQGTKIETLLIDKEILKRSGKKNPKLLFIPTASSDSKSYIDTVKNYFNGKLGCKVSTLCLTEKQLSYSQISKLIFGADIIYVGGGNTKKMLKIWKDNRVDVLLKEAYEKGIILSGLSAGAICWFKHGNSDSLTFSKKNSDMIRLSGLNLINILLCPHYDKEKIRKPSLKKMMVKTPGVSIALDNCAAIEIVDSTFRIISSKSTACAYKAFWFKGKYKHNKIINNGRFQPLSELFSKD